MCFSRFVRARTPEFETLLKVVLRCEFPLDSDKYIEFLFGQLK